MSSSCSPRLDYGADGWKYILSFSSGGGVALLGALGLASMHENAVWRVSSVPLAFVGALALVTGLLGVRYVKVGKFHHRDRVLDTIAWRGNERVLDVGTGAGLLLVGAAKRAIAGRAYGIDIWNQDDLSNNSVARAMVNISAERVVDRVEIRSEDARKMSFGDRTFDVVVSMLCIHNIPSEAGQDEALAEIARVLDKGGTALISDLANTERYAATLRRLGLEVVRSGPFWDTFPPQHLVRAFKPR